MLPPIWALLAWALSLSSGMECNFVARTVQLNPGVSEDILAIGTIIFRDHGIGFWGWGHDETCYSYDIAGNRPTFDSAYTVANGLTTVTDLIGGICLVFALLGTCFPIFPRSYWLLGSVFALNGFLECSTLAVLGSSACAPGFFNYATGDMDLAQLSTASCSLGSGSLLALSAGLSSFVAAAACLKSPLANKDRVPKLTVGPTGGDELDDNDPTKKLQQERQQEAEKRYKEMFGDEDGDEDIIPSTSETIDRPKLSQVKEGDQELSSEHLVVQKTQSRRSDDVEEFNDEDHNDDSFNDYDDDASLPGRGDNSNNNYDDSFADESLGRGKKSTGHNPFADKRNPFDDDDELQSLAGSEIV